MFVFPANLLAVSKLVFISIIAFLPTGTVHHIPQSTPTPTITVTVPLPYLIHISLKYHADLPVFMVLVGCHVLTVLVLVWLAINAWCSDDCSSGLGFVMVGTGTGLVNISSCRPCVADSVDQVIDSTAASSPPPISPPSSSSHVIQRCIIFLILVALICTCIFQPQVIQAYFHVYPQYLVSLFLSKSSSFLDVFLGALEQIEEMLDLLDPLRWLLTFPFISGLAITLYIHPNIFLRPPPLFSWSTQCIMVALFLLGIALVALTYSRNAPAPAPAPASVPVPQSEQDTSQMIQCTIRAFKVNTEQETEAGEMSGASEDTLVQELGLQADGDGDGDDQKKKVVMILRRGGDGGGNSPFFPARNEEDEDVPIPRGHAFPRDPCPHNDDGDGQVTEDKGTDIHTPVCDGEDDNEGRLNTDADTEPNPPSVQVVPIQQQCNSLSPFPGSLSSFGYAGERSETATPTLGLGSLSLLEDKANVMSNDEGGQKALVCEEFSVPKAGLEVETADAGTQSTSPSFGFNCSVPPRHSSGFMPIPTFAFPHVEGEAMLDGEYEHEHQAEIREQVSEDLSSFLAHTPTPIFQGEVMSNGRYEREAGISEGVSLLVIETEAGVEDLGMDVDARNDPIRDPSPGDDDDDGRVDVVADVHPYPTSIDLVPVPSTPLAPTLCYTPPMFSSDSTAGTPTPTPTPAFVALSLLGSDEGDRTEQTVMTPRSRWAGPMKTKRWPVYVLEGEGGDDRKPSVSSLEDEGKGGEVSLSLDMEDLLELGGSGWGRLLDVDVGVGGPEESLSGDDDSRWSTEVNVSADGKSRSGWDENREFDVDLVDEDRPATTHTYSTHGRTHTGLTDIDWLADVSISTVEKEAKDAVQAMHRRRAREREKAKERKRGGLVITVTPPTPKVVVVPASPVNGEEEEKADDEWALAMEMKQFWREKVEGKKWEREEERERSERAENSSPGLRFVRPSTADVTPSGVVTPRRRTSPTSRPVASSPSPSGGVRSSLNTATPARVPRSSLPSFSTTSPTSTSTHTSGGKATLRRSLPGPAQLPSPYPPTPIANTNSLQETMSRHQSFTPARSQTTPEPPTLLRSSQTTPSPTPGASRLSRVKSPALLSPLARKSTSKGKAAMGMEMKTQVRSPLRALTNRRERGGDEVMRTGVDR